MRTIISRQHALVKEFRRVAKGDSDLALLDGWHLVADAVRANITITTVAVTRSLLDADSQGVLERAAKNGAVIAEVAPAVANALSPVRTPTGIAALVERRSYSLSALLQPTPSLLVLAVDMQDPGNVGAVIRSAEAGGATGVVIAGTSADPWSWKALRAAMGSTLRLPVLHADNAPAVVAGLRAADVAVLATVPRDGIAMHRADMRKSVAVMIGGEGGGLTHSLVDAADLRVTIPMQGGVESLNAAVAAALLVYEARRQREERQ